MAMTTHDSNQIIFDLLIHRNKIVVLEICVCNALSEHCVAKISLSVMV
jgi:hypothetical protein